MNERITAQISSHRFLALPFTLWAMFFIVLPLFFVLGTGLTNEAGDVTLANLLTVLQSEYLRALGLSVELALISTFICLLLAYPLCLILKAKRDKRGLLVFLLFLLPLWMNSLLTTMAWQTILEKHGLINMLLSYLGLPAVHLINIPGRHIITGAFTVDHSSRNSRADIYILSGIDPFQTIDRCLSENCLRNIGSSNGRDMRARCIQIIYTGDQGVSRHGVSALYKLICKRDRHIVI